MKIDQLNKSITQMGPKEAHDFILQLRARRRVAPERTPTRRKRKKTPKPPNIGALLNALSSEQARALLNILEGDRNEQES